MNSTRSNSTGVQTRDTSVFTVSQLNQRAKQLLEISFASIKVEGEISNLSRPASGHWYFTLKDDKAQVRCAMFRSRAANLKFQPKEGDVVEVRAKVSLYENRGDYQLIVDGMKPAGEGALLLAFEQLKQRLGQEGLFAQENKQPIPPVKSIKSVAVITSATGAAIQDILSILKRRWPSIGVDIYPVLVQGKEAPAQIARALEIANHVNKADVIILGRGGGSLEDLWCFNDEGLARVIFASQIPIISAVGHEVDFTIADFVADVRAPTPSAAAELISPDQQEVFRNFQQYEQRLLQLSKSYLQQLTQHLDRLKQRLAIQSPKQKLLQQEQHLDQLEMRLMNSIHQHLKNKQQQIRLLDNSLKGYQPEKHLALLQKRLNQLNSQLEHHIKQTLQTKQSSLISNVRLLNSVNPLEVLGRGYSITQYTDGGIITDAQQVAIDDLIETRLHQGQVQSKVVKITKVSNADC